MPKQGVEEHARREGTLHPVVVVKLRRFFQPPYVPAMWDPAQTPIKVVRAFWGRLSGRRGGATAVFVQGRAIWAARRTLNRRGWVRGNCWDLATPQGFAALAHEVFHIWQKTTRSRRRALFDWGQWVRAILPWTDFHASMLMEQEAIAFEERVREELETKPDWLLILDAVRGANGRLPAIPYPGDNL